MSSPAHQDLDRSRSRARLRAALLSLVVGAALFGVKLLAYRATHSAAILSDALESIVNIVAAALATWSVWLSAQPADENHPYGHGKAEDFSAGVEGALIVLAAAGILWSAIPRFFEPRPLDQFGVGSVLIVLATTVNLALGLYLIRQGRSQHSRALEADGKHLLTDVVSSAGAVGALLAVKVTGWLWVDPAIACLIAIHILVSGFKLIRESVSRLMDEADAEALGRIARHLERHRRPEWIDVHELRAWWAGDRIHVDCHLVLPRYWSIERSHGWADDLADEVKAAMGPRGSVVVHVDPCRDQWCAICQVPDCAIRAEPYRESREWDRKSLVREVKV